MNKEINWGSFFARINHLPKEQLWLVDHAYQLSKHAHRIQKRSTGERYFEHTRDVALIIIDEFKLVDFNLICSAFLHDTGEDTAIWGNPTKMSYPEWRSQAHYLIARSFNELVADFVLAVTRPAVDGVEILTKKQAEEIALNNLSDGPDQAIILKMSDRIHNLRTLNGVNNPAKRQSKIEETRTSYYPIFKTIESRYPTVVKYALDQMEGAIAKVEL